MLLSPELGEDQAKKESEKIEKEITELGGAVSFNDFWGKKRLAYPVRKFTEGYYQVFLFTFPSENLKGFEKNLKLNKGVLRYLLTVTPKDYTSIYGSQVAINEEQYWADRKKKKVREPMVARKKVFVPTEMEHESKDTVEERAKKLDKILSDEIL